MAKLADAVAFLRTDDKELKSGLADADNQVTGWAGKLSGAIGGAAVGIAAAAGAVLVGATVAVGKAALDMGTEYQKGLNAIINGTGASGDALDAMGQSVRNLKSSAAGLGVDMEKIGATLAEVNTRTGATGSELEDLTGQILQFSRLTGTDSVQNVQLLTRTMGDWGVSMEDSGQLLDTIYGAGQAFGISVDSLAGKLVQFGAPLRQMGFSLEESTAMLGKWEKEGVNTELVIGSLRIAAGKFARENVPLQDGLRQTMEAIKGAASESEGLAIAMDVFGARAGPDMAAAIREGRFELDGAIAALQGTQGGLADAAERTLTFQDRWGIAMAQIGDALIPLGQKLMDLADRVMPFLTAAIVVVIDAVVPLVDWIVQAIDAVIGLIGSNEQLTDSFGQVGGVIQSTFGPIVERAQEIFGALGEKVSTVVGQNLNFFRAWIDQNMPRIQQIVSTVLGAITAFWEKHGAAIVAAVQRYFGWIMEFW
ncbi:MAG: phage tail tape measure protein, partial [Caldilineaceae bacterium]|nr:phage tail tape measure protein [Caldilineaceae bacterium]